VRRQKGVEARTHEHGSGQDEAAGEPGDARRWFEQLLAVTEALVAAGPGNAEWQRHVALSYGKAGAVAAAAGKLDDARACFERSLAVSQRLAAADPVNTVWRRDLSTTCERLGDVAMAAGKLDDARVWFEQALAHHELAQPAPTRRPVR
jgi:tetratricopeptide (TPR) repeat protein